MRIALVYDRLNKWGGAERVLLALHEIWPKAPLFTAVYNPKTAPWAADFDVRTSFLQRFPWAKTHHEFYPWLTPLVFESFNFDEFDIVISVTSADAKGIITKPKTLHICYCLTPTRYLWSGYRDYFPSKISRCLTLPVVSYLRAWDKIASTRPDKYIAISENVKKRIKKYYGRDSTVIYPPLDTEKFSSKHPKPYTLNPTPYFLVVSRLVRYKRIDIAVEAFNKLGLPLKIVGSGREENNLKKMAQKNIEFLGNLTDRELIGYYQGCQALVFPTDEDFGLIPLEAQACGRPVIALGSGGALETVVDPAKSRGAHALRDAGQEGATGEFFYPQTAEALRDTIQRYKDTKIQRERFKPEDCRKNAERFSKGSFKKKFKNFVAKAWKAHKKSL